MEIISAKNLSFQYNKAKSFALKDIDLSVNTGEFQLLIGESGSGKTTLLKMMKKELTPHGDLQGEILFKGNKISFLTSKESASKIGFIMQDPDSQIVTDKVYSELAFGLENLGVKRETIRAKVSEFASYFGLEDKFECRTSTLSGGEKQLLNLASVMVMNPEVLILDEPTSMLDPISALEFVTCLKRLNDDLGITIIIAEHHLSQIYELADKVVYLENGTIIAIGSPAKISDVLKNKKIEYTLPAPVRVYHKLGGEGEVPLTVKDGKKFLQKNNNYTINYSINEIKTNPIIKAKDLWFRYERGGADILKGFNLTVNSGEIYALVGSNGSGKTTVVNLLSGVLKPYKGKVKRDKSLATLPQNPRDLFVKDKLEDDFKNVNNSYKELCYKFEIAHLLSQHPYDLSGGEIQRAAIVKILLFSPDILLLDEPTKGLDAFAKKELGEFLRSLNLTILLVTHDLEFAAEFSDRCGLLFDGAIMSDNNSREFFLGNNFYTTPVVKMTKDISHGAVTIEDIKVES